MLDIKKVINYEKKLPKEEREIYCILKPYIKYFTPDEFDNLFNGVILQKILIQRLNQLKHFQSLGLNSYEQINKYLEKGNIP